MRNFGAYEKLLLTPAMTAAWRRAAEVCTTGLDGGLYLDVSECIEGRMAVNDFTTHFLMHFIGGDMMAAAVPADPIVCCRGTRIPFGGSNSS